MQNQGITQIILKIYLLKNYSNDIIINKTNMGITNLILNNLNYSVILFDENLVLKFLNLPAQELTGYSDRFLNNLTLSRFFNNNAYIEEKVKNVMQTGEGFIEFEYKFQNKNLY